MILITTVNALVVETTYLIIVNTKWGSDLDVNDKLSETITNKEGE